MSVTRRRLRAAARRLLEEAARDFRTSAPGVRVASPAEVRELCNVEAAACYLAGRKEIVVDERWAAHTGTLLHEFAHHLQLEESGGDPYRAFTDLGKPHCERPHEIAAKWFADDFADFYKRRHEALLGGARGPRRDGGLACGFAALRFWQRAEGAARELEGLGAARRPPTEWERDRARSTAEAARFYAAAFARACGVGDRLGEVLTDVDWALMMAEGGDFLGAAERLRRARASALLALRRE